VMIGVLFYYPNRDVNAIVDTSGPIENHVQVIGKQWSWDFNYLDDDAFETGQHAQDVGEAGTGVLKDQVTLWLPVDESVEFTLNSRDVIHSFWVPAARFKRDEFPKRHTRFDLTFDRVGTYIGRCAEFCGLRHTNMDFFVRVVPRAAFDRWVRS
jgi:cytochrome c oxidase subunit II